MAGLINFCFYFQAVTLALLNAIVNNTPSYNERIFHQQQICVAGFSDQHLEKVNLLSKSRSSLFWRRLFERANEVLIQSYFFRKSFCVLDFFSRSRLSPCSSIIRQSTPNQVSFRNYFTFCRAQILEDLDATPVRDELKVWRDNFVNIQDLMDEYLQLKERSKLLRDEVYDAHRYTGQIEIQKGRCTVRPIRIVQSLALLSDANARIVRQNYPYWQYTDLIVLVVHLS